MSNGPPNGPQTPQRFAPAQATPGLSPYGARPGAPISLAPVQPSHARPMGHFRPNLGPNQQQMFHAPRAPTNAAYPQQLTQQQQLMQQQQQQQMMQQQQQQQQMRNVRPNPTMFSGNTNIAVAGVVAQQPQPHPALMARKRKSKAAEVGEESDSEEESAQALHVALARYQQNHNLLAEVFMALPLSSVREPPHYYSTVDREQVAGRVAQAEAELQACELQRNKTGGLGLEGGEFEQLVEEMREAKGEHVEVVKRKMEELLGVAFVGDAYRTVERVRVQAVDAVEGAVYGQL
ncbi:hypothetical protein LPJ73_000162 [Coemansia sp. RSA 2703]|nr:hypothetical protein LPJ73_000162 [Coemansia sp. RSA 2703]KAJ2379495.1 hypothetical protein IW150_000125 [Coemansia sp. RSA 2607]